MLNGRGGVRPQTVEKVILAARALGYPREMPEVHRGLIRIEVMLVRPETTFFSRLSQAFERIAATLDPSITLHRTFLDEARPEAIASRIARPPARRSALICAIPDHGAIRAALTQITDAGIPVVQAVSRAPVRADYVGIDNLAAGRTAALLLARMQPHGGRVVALCHSGIYQVHRERIRGFSEGLARQGRADFRFDAVLFHHDDALAASEALGDALARWPDLVGLYNAGGANASLAAVLRGPGRGRGIFFVGHELTERSAAALREGVMSIVLDQAPEEQARRAVDLALSRLGILTTPVANPPIRFTTITAENI
ncbi:LacI family transcriptional regulator [Labrys miyagiensis]|uniref:LacI family transcriptional regulator n=1 Tax=Labrys miyagiensis TaxID=346912 RepID=A0ABQ6CC77_9HYPH|nr:LacI family transcriptional regulator [Labrys miyagiensis]